MKTSNIGNLISNYGSRLWSLISVFIFIPVYIHFLGIESYAVIGFYSLLLGIISFADAGMSSAVIKEFALDNEPSYKYSVLRRVENLYLFVCFSLMALIVGFSKIIAVNWLTSENIPVNDLAYYISLIGFGITIQLLSSLYFGSLFGLNKQVKANSYQIILNILKSAGVILIMYLYNPSLEVYFLWQIICNIVYVILLRYNTIEILKKDTTELRNYLKSIPPDILKYIGGMTIIAVISSINSQADKIITSSFFSLEVFGYYNIASIISQLPVILGAPLTLFVFPLFSKFSGSNNENNLKVCFEKISFLLSIIVLPAAISLLFYTAEIMKLWTGDTINPNVFPTLLIVIKLLTTGSLFLVMQFPLYYLLLAKGKTKYTIYQGVVQILLGLPLLLLCAKYFGLISLGLPWILINLGSLIYLSIIVFKKYIKINYISFLKEFILIPFLITITIYTLLYFIYIQIQIGFYGFIILSGILSIAFCLIFSNYKNRLPLIDIKNLYNFPN